MQYLCRLCLSASETRANETLALFKLTSQVYVASTPFTTDTPKSFSSTPW